METKGLQGTESVKPIDARVDEEIVWPRELPLRLIRQ